MLKYVTACLWVIVAMLAGAILDAVVTVFVFKKYGGCPMLEEHKKLSKIKSLGGEGRPVCANSTCVV